MKNLQKSKGLNKDEIIYSEQLPESTLQEIILNASKAPGILKNMQYDGMLR